MATDDMKPEMIRVLQAMFNTDEGEMNIEQIAGSLQLPSQQAQYYVEELGKKRLVHYLVNSPGHRYGLTREGRAYVMENLMSNKNS